MFLLADDLPETVTDRQKPMTLPSSTTGRWAYGTLSHQRLAFAEPVSRCLIKHRTFRHDLVHERALRGTALDLNCSGWP